MNNQSYCDSFTAEILKSKKRKFLALVGNLARLRDLQYGSDSAAGIIKIAEKVVALNLPSNVMRASAVFVDYFYGFPPDEGSFFPPRWVTEKAVLPECERGSLSCTGLKDMSALQENDLVVLTDDVALHGLHAGMAGIVRELSTEDGGAENDCMVEFGEPDDCVTRKVEVSIAILRRPRPGDLLENYHP